MFFWRSHISDAFHSSFSAVSMQMFTIFASDQHFQDLHVERGTSTFEIWNNVPKNSQRIPTDLIHCRYTYVSFFINIFSAMLICLRTQLDDVLHSNAQLLHTLLPFFNWNIILLLISFAKWFSKRWRSTSPKRSPRGGHIPFTGKCCTPYTPISGRFWGLESPNLL